MQKLAKKNKTRFNSIKAINILFDILFDEKNIIDFYVIEFKFSFNLLSIQKTYSFVY